MDVWQLMPTRGMDGTTQKAELVCAVCNTPVVMVLNEAGTETGDLTAMRERKKVGTGKAVAHFMPCKSVRVHILTYVMPVFFQRLTRVCAPRPSGVGGGDCVMLCAMRLAC